MIRAPVRPVQTAEAQARSITETTATDAKTKKQMPCRQHRALACSIKQASENIEQTVSRETLETAAVNAFRCVDGQVRK